MHYFAEGLITDNGISGIALAFFSAILTAVGGTVVAVLQLKTKATEAQSAALEAKAEAEQARKNTTSISNGFAGGVDRKLDLIINEQIKQKDTLQRHLEWHIDHSSQERN